MSIEERIKQFNGSGFDKRSYSVAEVEKKLGVTRQTVYKLIKRGCFEAVKVQGGHRIVKASFDRWLDGEEV